MGTKESQIDYVIGQQTVQANNQFSSRRVPISTALSRSGSVLLLTAENDLSNTFPLRIHLTHSGSDKLDTMDHISDCMPFDHSTNFQQSSLDDVNSFNLITNGLEANKARSVDLASDSSSLVRMEFVDSTVRSMSQSGLLSGNQLRQNDCASSISSSLVGHETIKFDPLSTRLAKPFNVWVPQSAQPTWQCQLQQPRSQSLLHQYQLAENSKNIFTSSFANIVPIQQAALSTQLSPLTALQVDNIPKPSVLQKTPDQYSKPLSSSESHSLIIQPLCLSSFSPQSTRISNWSPQITPSGEPHPIPNQQIPSTLPVSAFASPSTQMPLQLAPPNAPSDQISLTFLPLDEIDQHLAFTFPAVDPLSTANNHHVELNQATDGIGQSTSDFNLKMLKGNSSATRVSPASISDKNEGF
ncbi:unnamed protein product [Protopolystoma xenopodis]|uniref:Uncharacterized protein n=1 Tax=Protopolystoma xenopodis TaxID=117903 RepID=A0A448X1X0_9PLAT|nr:unnamed protein product [Protopolystoma xenopodis]